MRIEFSKDIKHAGHTHHAGDQIQVDDGLGTYFLNCGWATRLDGETPPAEPPPFKVVLDVQPGTLGHQADNLGGTGNG